MVIEMRIGIRIGMVKEKGIGIGMIIWSVLGM